MPSTRSGSASRQAAVVRRRWELAVLAGDKIVGQGETGHRLEAAGPSFQMRPVSDLEPALGHENHATPAADIRDRAGVAEEEGPVLHRLVDKRQCRLRARAELGDDLVMHLAQT